MRVVMIGVGVVAVLVAGFALWRLWPAPVMSKADYDAVQAQPVAVPQGPQRVYHLGHSLVGRDMPAMLAAAAGHDWQAQLGWGASLNNHLTGDVPGFAEENAHPHFRPAAEAIGSGDYPVVVLTEMVELKDAIRYHHSARALAEWTRRAQAADPGARLYLYETWHRTGDPAGWAARVEADGVTLWQDGLLRPAMAEGGVGRIMIIPGGPVMLAVARAAEAGQIPGVTARDALFSDDIHMSDLGAWLMAMTHYAVIYGRTPEGLPHLLRRADGALAGAPSDAAARAMQALVWQVVTAIPATGVRG